MHTGYLGARAAEVLRVRAFPMEMRIQLTQEIQYFAICMTLMQARFVIIFLLAFY